MKRTASCLIAAILWLANPAWAAPGIETLLVIEPTAENPRNSEGDIEVLSDGSLCFVYTRFSGGAEDFSAAGIVARTSVDEGKSWSKERVLVPNEGKFNVMSVSLLRLKSGEILLFYLTKNSWGDLNLWVRRSADDLKTLSGPVRATTLDGYHVVNNDRVVQLSSGRILVPAALHPCPDGTEATWSDAAIPLVYYSDDEGLTWKKDETDPTKLPIAGVTLQEPGLVELSDGRILMYHRADGGSQFQSYSSDGGFHWTTPAPGPLVSPLSPATIKRIPWSGDLLAVWNDHSGQHTFLEKRRTPLCAAISHDDGKSWGKSLVIEGNPDGWYCYTSMTFLSDRVVLSYCAGDKEVGGLNRLKVTSLSKDWLYQD
jgi:hypothetical protein